MMTDGQFGQLDMIADIEFFQNPRMMIGYGMRADKELISDLLLTHTLEYQAQNLMLPCGEIGKRIGMLIILQGGDRFGDLGVDMDSAGGDIPDGAQQNRWRRMAADHTPHTQFQQLPGQPGILIQTDHQYFHPGLLLQNFVDALHGAQGVWFYHHQQQIMIMIDAWLIAGLMALNMLQYRDISLGLEQALYAGFINRRIFDQLDTNRI